MKGTYQSDNDFLLSAVQRGDQKAFDTLFRRYYPMLCAYGHRFVELEDAEEIVEDSLLWIWENRETLVIESSLNSYLFKMVYRRALNKLAHIDATQRADTRFYEEMQEMLQDTDYYQIEELAKRIEDAVAALPESYREAFVMHRFRDMSYKEIAETLGVSLGNEVAERLYKSVGFQLTGLVENGMKELQYVFAKSEKCKRQ